MELPVLDRKTTLALLLLLPGRRTIHPSKMTHGMIHKIVGITILVVIVLGSFGCAEQPTPYRPPTTVYQTAAPSIESPTPPPTEQSSLTLPAQPTPPCTDSLSYLEDVTFPDGAIVQPGASLDKRWLIQNSGTCNWDERYRLKFVSGADLGAPLDQALFPARSGTKTTLRVNFTAPSEPGTYQSAWQAYNPQGQPFGDPISLQVVVSTSVP